MTPREVEALYREMGKTFAALEPWQIYVLTSAENFERLYGRRADKIRKLYNGMLPCSLYQFFKPAAKRENDRPTGARWKDNDRGKYKNGGRR